MIRFACPHCRHTYEHDVPGHQFTCVSCGGRLEVPDPDPYARGITTKPWEPEPEDHARGYPARRPRYEEDDWDDRPRRRRRRREQDQPGFSIASMVLGCVGLLAWCLPILGLPVTITGLALGVRGLSSRSTKGLAIAGVALCGVGLLLSMVNAAVGAYMGATGQHPLLQ
jgi:hypothetical protein